MTAAGVSVEAKTAQLARRSFLKAVGGATAAFPFFGMLQNSFAQASSGVLPLKFVGINGFHGTSEMFWARRPGEPLSAELDSDQYDIGFFDSPLRPFDEPARYGHSFKKQIIIFEGFDYGVGYNATIPYGISSHGASAILLTGSAITDSDYATMKHTVYNESLDQYLAQRYGGQTKFRSVEIATDSLAYQQSGTAIAVGSGGALLNTMVSPAAIFDRFFAGFAPAPNASAAAAAHRRAVGKSVLDFVIGDLRRLQSRLAGTERQKLDQHLTAMRDLERRISEPAPVALECTVPARRAPTGNANPEDNYVAGSAFDAGKTYQDKVANMQIELLAEILVCDLTRFGTVVFPGSPGTLGGVPIPRPGASGTQVTSAVGRDIDFAIPAAFHEDVAHTYSFGTHENQRAAAAVNRYFHSKVARLMARLKEAGALDSTLILVGNEGGTGNHVITNIPLVLAGGANGAIRMGRRVTAPGRTPRANARPVPTANPSAAIRYASTTPPTSHVPILVAIANAFHRQAGAPEIDSFGTSTTNPEMLRGISGLI